MIGCVFAGSASSGGFQASPACIYFHGIISNVKFKCVDNLFENNLNDLISRVYLSDAVFSGNHIITHDDALKPAAPAGPFVKKLVVIYIQFLFSLL